MDGKRVQNVENDRPITKPSFPLPIDFSPSKRSELATRRKSNAPSGGSQQAHFYRKRTTDSGTPVYDFFITEGPDQDLRKNH